MKFSARSEFLSRKVAALMNFLTQTALPRIHTMTEAISALDNTPKVGQLYWILKN